VFTKGRHLAEKYLVSGRCSEKSYKICCQYICHLWNF